MAAVLTSRRGTIAPKPGGGSGETFTGSNDAAWPAGWTTFNDATIQTNRGRLTDATSGFATGWRNAAPAVTDFDLTVTFFATPGLIRIGVAASQAINWMVPNNGHIAVVSVVSGGVVSIQLMSFKVGSGTEIAWAPFTAIPAGAGGGWHFRMQRVGAVVRARVWADDVAEPGSWTAAATDSNPPGTTTDRPWLSYANGGGTGHADFDNLVG